MSYQIDFFVPGFSKCGTTSLFEVLNAHPSVFIPKIKEPNIFLKGTREEIERQISGVFSYAPEGSFKGDCSTFYTAASCAEECAEKIYQHNPAARFIFLARDPILRIESSYREMHTNGPLFGLDTPYNLYDAFKALPQLIGDTMFFSRMKAFENVFGKEKIHVVFLEDLKANVVTEADKCFEFLGLEPFKYVKEDMPRTNEAKDKLYDSRLMRAMRNSAFFGKRLSKMHLRDQDKWAVPLGLRRKFKEDVKWDEKSKRYVMENIAGDIEAFLNREQRNRELWPKYNSEFNNLSSLKNNL